MYTDKMWTWVECNCKAAKKFATATLQAKREQNTLGMELNRNET